MIEFLNTIGFWEFLGTAVVALLGILAKPVFEWAKESGVTESIAKYDYLADIAVRAAEQIYNEEQGAEKMAYAKNYILDLAKSFGIKLSGEQLEGFIEAAVKRVHDAQKESENVVSLELTDEKPEETDSITKLY